jgi:hypothetical protein
LLDVRSFRGANADPDHYLLMAGLRDRITRLTDRRTIKTGNKYDTERLKRTEVKQENVNKLVTRVEESDKDNIDWQTLQQIITNTAEVVSGKLESVEGN